MSFVENVPGNSPWLLFYYIEPAGKTWRDLGFVFNFEDTRVGLMELLSWEEFFLVLEWTMSLLLGGIRYVFEV